MSDFTVVVCHNIYSQIVICIAKVTAKVENSRYEKNLNDMLIINTIFIFFLLLDLSPATRPLAIGYGVVRWELFLCL